MTPELMPPLLVKSFSRLEAFLQKIIGFGFVLGHFLGFLLSSTFYLLEHWFTWIVSYINFFYLNEISILQTIFCMYQYPALGYFLSFVLVISFIWTEIWRLTSSFYADQFSALGDSKAIVVDKDETKKNEESFSGQHTEEGEETYWIFDWKSYINMSLQISMNKTILPRWCFIPFVYIALKTWTSVNNCRHCYVSKKFFKCFPCCGPGN